jgi:hypothetical protein
VIWTLPVAADPPLDDELPPLPPPHAATTSAIAPASATRLQRRHSDSDPLLRGDPIDAPPETFVVVMRSSQPTTHHVERGPGS